MISMLRGKIWAVQPGQLVVDVNGVGYAVHCVQPLLDELCWVEVGERVIELHIQTTLREDAMVLYGFQSLEEKTWFQVLTGVQGVGGKTALSILGSVGIEGLLEAIATEQTSLLKQAKGVGERLALRIISELHGKVSDEERKALEGRAVDAETIAAAKAALMKLGYKANEAGKAAKEAALEDVAAGASLSTIVRHSLLRLGPA